MRQFSKKELDMLVEIRRRIKRDLGDTIKLADPDLLDVLIDYWPKTRDAVARSRIRELIDAVGGEQSRRLDKIRRQAEKEARSRSYLS